MRFCAGVLRAVGSWTGVCCLAACVRGPTPPSPQPDAPGVDHVEHRSVATSDADAEPSPDRAHPEGFVELEIAANVDGGRANALVWDPGGTRARPLLIVTHGAGGGPEWHCARWASIVQDRAFVMGIQGRSMGGGGGAYYYPQHHDLKERVTQLHKAFLQRFGQRHIEGQSVYAGYSQGATMGALMLPDLGQSFPFALLIEGGYEQWPVASAVRYAKSGGRRIYFACGTGSCSRGAQRSVDWLHKGSVEAKTDTAQGAGHTPAGAVGELAAKGLAWLTRDSSAWR